MSLREDELKEFYERSYMDSTNGERSGRWRGLGAKTKADHIVRLLGSSRPDSILEVGCGDGAVLAELGRRGIGELRVGLEISSSALALASARPEVTEAHLFDGQHIASQRVYDLVIATHVLEHVPEPKDLLESLVGVARAVVLEVPLEDNLLARRPAARALSEAAGHLHRFGRSDIRAMIGAVGWSPRNELLDPLPLAVHTFERRGPARISGYGKWAVRSALAAVPALGERVMTMHYAVLALPA